MAIELLQNGDAEEPIVGGQIPGWTKISNNNWGYRSANPAPQSGSNYFFAGATGFSQGPELRQVCSLAPYAAKIAAGRGVVTWRGYMRNFSGSDLTLQMVQFYDSGGSVISGAGWSSGWVDSPSAWTLATTALPVPTNAETVWARLLSDKNSGTNNDGYHDNVSLQLSFNTFLIGLSSPTAVGRGLLVGSPLESIEVRGDGALRLRFTSRMTNNAALRNVSTYVLTTGTPGAVVPLVNKVVPEDVLNPIYVDLQTDEHTDGALYDLAVTGISDKNGGAVAGSVSYTGEGTPPIIKQIIAVSTNRADVVFTELMLDNAQMRDPAQYVWDNGLTTIQVLEVAGNTARLVTSDQTPGVLYTLTIPNA